MFLLLRILAYKEQYPDRVSARVAISELKSILNLPAGTTYYFSDIHGQGDKFSHIINNKAGVIKKKLERVFSYLSEEDRTELLKICYYPLEMVALMQFQKVEEERFVEIIDQLATLIRHVGSKITGKALNDKIQTSRYFGYTIYELVNDVNLDKIDPDINPYKQDLIREFITNETYPDLILDMVRILKEILVYKYVINGDIPDRGPDTAFIIDTLMQTDNVEFNWGNHDLGWMGAALGSRELITEVIRLQLRYGHVAVLEKDYDISLQDLAIFAENTYSAFASTFLPQTTPKKSPYSENLISKMYKAISVILWKMEGAREKDLDVRGDLNYLKRENNIFMITINGVDFNLIDQDFPTIDINNLTKLTSTEQSIINALRVSFRNSKRLQKHMNYLAQIGSLYNCEDGILSFHATIPVNPDGTLTSINIMGESFAGKQLFDKLSGYYKEAFQMREVPQKYLDLFYLGWKGPHFCTFGKASMETFNRALIENKETHYEEKSVYYKLLEDSELGPKMTNTIIKDFSGKDSDSVKIYNGHIPVKVNRNEAPVKLEGSIICGDGGFSEAYGDIGFVFVTTSRGLFLKQLGPKVTVSEVLGPDSKDINPTIIYSETYPKRKQLKDCVVGNRITNKIDDLRKLIKIYDQKNDSQ